MYTYDKRKFSDIALKYGLTVEGQTQMDRFITNQIENNVLRYKLNGGNCNQLNSPKTKQKLDAIKDFLRNKIYYFGTDSQLKTLNSIVLQLEWLINSIQIRGKKHEQY